MSPLSVALVPLAILLVLFISPLVRTVRDRYRIKWTIASLGLPSFQGYPFVGNLLQVLGIRGKLRELSYGYYVQQAAFGFVQVFRSEHDFTYGSLGMTSYVAFFKAKTVEALLSSPKEINKTSEYEVLSPWLGKGLLTSGEDTWKKKRKMLTPSFHFRILEQFQPIMSKHSDVLVERFRQALGKNFINIDTLISDCTFDIVAETAFGVKVGAQSKDGSPIVKAVTNVSASLFERLIKPWQWSDWLYWISPSGRKFQKSLNVIQTYVRKVIQEKKKKLAEEAELSTGENGIKCRAFLELLLLHNMENKDNQLTDEEIEFEVNTFNFAGFDTTAVSMCWTLYMLGLYPEIQRKVHEELDDIFAGDDTRLVELEDIKRMQYLERVIKETQRLYPAVPFIARQLQEDFAIGDVVLPKGATCIVIIGPLHRDPEYFPNPEVFDPDRFLDNNNRHPFAFVPFSAGPRNCIGQRFAMMEMKTTIASLLRKFKLTSLDPRDRVLVQPELTNRPHKPIRQRVELRQNS